MAKDLTVFHHFSRTDLSYRKSSLHCTLVTIFFIFLFFDETKEIGGKSSVPICDCEGFILLENI